jgi:undecaprenyl-diphosphatase
MQTPFWQAYDESISRWLHSHANPFFDQAMAAITRVGNPLALIMATTLLAFLLWRLHQLRRVALLYAGAAYSSFYLNGWLKRQFERPRPQLWQQIIPLPSDASFPSGHAMISMTVYGLAAWLLAERYPRWRRLILLVAVLLIFSIGLSRVYLGVHWPSDVLAGFLFGLLIITASGVWHHKRHRSLATQINVTPDEQPS